MERRAFIYFPDTAKAFRDAAETHIRSAYPGLRVMLRNPLHYYRDPGVEKGCEVAYCPSQFRDVIEDHREAAIPVVTEDCFSADVPIKRGRGRPRKQR